MTETSFDYSNLSGRPNGPVVKVATDAKVNFSTSSDTLPLSAEHPRKVVKLAEQYGVTSSIGRLQKALDALPGE